MTEEDLEPLMALVLDLEEAKRGVVAMSDDPHEPEFRDATKRELLERLFDLYWHGRNAYDALAAQVDGARSYGEYWGQGGPDTPLRDHTDEDTPF